MEAETVWCALDICIRETTRFLPLILLYWHPFQEDKTVQTPKSRSSVGGEEN
jgi:hypothetical protein